MTVVENEPVVVKGARPRTPLQRIGCGILLIFWFALLLVPCGLLFLAVQQEIIIPQGDVPGAQTRIWLIMEARQRGIGISTASVQQEGLTACVQTDARFLLWSGQSDPLQYCECYQQADSDAAWQYTVMNEGVCTPSS